MLFWAASDRYNRYQQSDLTTAIKYKMVALRVLNERMSEVTQATMDDTIGTVTAAAGFELFMGTLEAYRVHMDGLQQIIRLRGGFQSLQVSNPQLALFIAWSDYLLSTYTSDKLTIFQGRLLQQRKFGDRAQISSSSSRASTASQLFCPETIWPSSKPWRNNTDREQHRCFPESRTDGASCRIGICRFTRQYG